VRYEAADRTCREEVFNLADDILLYSSFVGGHSYVPSMNVDTAARSVTVYVTGTDIDGAIFSVAVSSP